MKRQRRNAAALGASFYDRDPADVARALIGKLLLRQSDERTAAGIIVETEAYLACGDAACHAARGKTRRNAAMFGPPGSAYVYMIHSRWCFNVVTEREGTPSAVLIRALEPTVGVEVMAARRGMSRPHELARGPARLCAALSIDRSFDGFDLTRGESLWIEDFAGQTPPPIVVASPRIGISAACDLPLRFFAADNRFVSRPHWSRQFVP
jgi:DNA-3-methyladenine glycosylase